MNTLSFFLIVTSALVLLTADSANAYLDLGSGSYMLQIFLAGLFGVLFILKSYWKKVCKSLILIFKRLLFH